jgi:hypothetical protein
MSEAVDLKEDAVEVNREAVITTNVITGNIIKGMAAEGINSKPKIARKLSLLCGPCLSVHLPRLTGRSTPPFHLPAEWWIGEAKSGSLPLLSRRMWLGQRSPAVYSR